MVRERTRQECLGKTEGSKVRSHAQPIGVVGSEVLLSGFEISLSLGDPLLDVFGEHRR
jgi:hypothetical protein